MKKIFYNKGILQLLSLVGLILICFPNFYSYGKYISLAIIVCLLPALYKEFIIKHDFLKSSGGKFGIIFIISYIITICFSSKTDIISSLHGLVWTVINFLIIYAYDKKDDITEKKKTLLFVNNIIIIVTTIISIISMILYFNLISINVDGWTIGMNAGRNSGITIDPIQLSWIAFMAIGCALINIILHKKRDWLMYATIVSLIINFISLETTITRNSVYTAMAMIIMVIGAIVFCRFNGKFLKKFSIACVVMIVATVAIFCVDITLKKTMSNMLTYVEKEHSSVIENSNKTDNAKENSNVDNTNTSKKTTPNESNNEELITDNFSRTSDQYGFKYGLSGRYEIWMCGLNVVKEYPLFGVSTGDMMYHTYELNKYSKNMEILGNPGVFVSQHNGLMQVLVASGIVGLVFSTLVILVGLYRVFKEYLCNLGNTLKERELVAVLFSIAVIMFFIMNIGQTVSYFMVSFINCYFWYILHHLMYFFEQKEEVGK